MKICKLTRMCCAVVLLAGLLLVDQAISADEATRQAAGKELREMEQRTLSGGAIGAGGGALLGGVSGGDPAVGAVLGGAAGALTGYILGDRDSRPRRRR